MQKLRIFVKPEIKKFIEVQCENKNHPRSYYYQIENYMRALLVLGNRWSIYDKCNPAYTTEYYFLVEDEFYHKYKNNVNSWVNVQFGLFVENIMDMMLMNRIEAHVKYWDTFRNLSRNQRYQVGAIRIKARTVIRDFMDEYKIEESEIKSESLYKRYVRMNKKFENGQNYERKLSVLSPKMAKRNFKRKLSKKYVQIKEKEAAKYLKRTT